VIVGILVLLSLILTVTTVFPSLPLGPFTAVTVVLGAAGLIWLGLSSRKRQAKNTERLRAVGGDRRHWRMAPLATLKPPVWSQGQRIGMYVLRGYLVVAVLVLGLKIGQVATGH
jgi:hypothetical protein